MEMAEHGTVQDSEGAENDRLWPIILTVLLVVVVAVNAAFIYIAVTGADDVVPAVEVEFERAGSVEAALEEMQEQVSEMMEGDPRDLARAGPGQVDFARGAAEITVEREEHMLSGSRRCVYRVKARGKSSRRR